MKRELIKGERVWKFATSLVKQANDADRTIEHVISARTVDRDGDVMEPRGARVDNYRKNPVVLFGHSSWKFPVGKNVALEISDTDISALTHFAGLDQAHQEAETAYRLARDGFLNAWSVGFMPITWSEDKALPDQDGWWFKEWELFEYSLVPIPSNPEALSRFAKGLKLPAGATEQDFFDAVKKDVKHYLDVGAAVQKAGPDGGDALVLELGALKQRVAKLEATAAAPASPPAGSDRKAVEAGIREAFAEFTGAAGR